MNTTDEPITGLPHQKDIRQSRLLIVDTESTCWDNAVPPDQRPEIIQIGIAELNFGTAEITRDGNFFCLPESSEISPFCTSLTGISKATLKKQGMPFNEACRLIAKKFGSKNKHWAGWGRDDRTLETECYLKKAENPFSDSYLNISLLYSLLTQNPQRMSLYNAMKTMDVEPVGVLHDGHDDAVNTARLLLALMNRFPRIGTGAGSDDNH